MRHMCLLVVLVASLGWATEPPPPGKDFPTVLKNINRDRPAFLTFRRALRPLMARVLASRQAIEGGSINKWAGTIATLTAQPGTVSSLGPAVVSGTHEVPVLLSLYSDTAGNPFPPATLQQELFGSWPSGTMSDLYREMSHGLFTVSGQVSPWKRLPKKESYYVGADVSGEPCYGLCAENSKVPEMLKAALQLNNNIDWGKYDNDGPDGIPNSGDDDGYVDFVAFVHPSTGGECSDGNRHIWSHRASLSGWGVAAYETTSPRKGGGHIMIDDYVIMPGLACDGSTMIQIGVFAHEFGHAFGLPDLYDTDRDNGKSEGLGNWCLMAAGSWGGDGHSPDRPVHMSAWAKSFMGWVSAEPLAAPEHPTKIIVPYIEDATKIFQLNISDKRYYLLTAVARKGFNEKLPASGLQIFEINDTVLNAGLRNNRVNADHLNKGVDLVEANGLNGLDSPGYRGGPGDLFPGDSGKTEFDSQTNPINRSKVAICTISQAGEPAQVSVIASSGLCANLAAVGDVPTATLREINEKPERYMNKVVTITGTLENKSSNYFDPAHKRRIVLTDQEGNAADVKIQMPTETTPTNGSEQNPVSQSAVLGKTVDAKVKVGSENGKPSLTVVEAKPQ